jgi:hypothetical protein
MEVVMQHLDEGTIHAWLDGALPPDEARQAELHVGTCESCAAAVAEARGLIAASSMILSKLDTFPASVNARFEGGLPPVDDIAAARAASEARQRPVRRSWFASSGFRAAAAVLVLAGGVAVVQNVTGRDELARIVNDQAMEAKVSGDESVPDEPMASQDATANATAQPEVPPPPPVVAAAPVHPLPAPRAGRPGSRREAATGGAVAGADGAGLVGTRMGMGAGATTPEAVRTTAAPAPTAVPAVIEQTAGRAVMPQGNVLGAAQQSRAAEGTERRQERDFASAAKAAAPQSPPPAAEAATLRGVDTVRFADTTVALQRARLREESAEPARNLAPASVGVAGRIASSAIAGLTDRADAASGSRCYALTLTPWSPAKATIPGAPATRIILSPDTGTAGPSKGQRLVRPMPGSFEGSYQAAWWTEVSPSTLILTWATGSEGIIMRLVRSGNELAGTARTFGTTGGVEQSSSVQGERVDCGDAR